MSGEYDDHDDVYVVGFDVDCSSAEVDPKKITRDVANYLPRHPFGGAIVSLATTSLTHSPADCDVMLLLKFWRQDLRSQGNCAGVPERHVYLFLYCTLTSFLTGTRSLLRSTTPTAQCARI